MNRVDTSTPLAAVSDFILDLTQPDGSSVRVCVNTGLPGISLGAFLNNLALRGLIARGGGSPEKLAAFEAAASRKGIQATVDNGQEPRLASPFACDGDCAGCEVDPDLRASGNCPFKDFPKASRPPVEGSKE